MILWQYIDVIKGTNQPTTVYPPQDPVLEGMDAMDALNMLGMKGWELVGVSELANPGGWQVRYVLKRAHTPETLQTETERLVDR